MKTTVEIPEPLFRQAKADGAEEEPWMRAFGVLRELHRETRRLERVVAEEFERIDHEEWR